MKTSIILMLALVRLALRDGVLTTKKMTAATKISGTCMNTITTVMIDDKGLSMNGMSEQREEHEARLTMAMSLGLRKPHLKLMTFNTDLTRRPNTSTLKT